jgi:RNA polymerase sigma factor (sigma-70 family)
VHITKQRAIQRQGIVLFTFLLMILLMDVMAYMSEHKRKYSLEEIREDIAQMYCQYYSYVCKRLRHRLNCTKEVAEELAQEIFLRIQIKLIASDKRVEYPQALLHSYIEYTCKEWFNRSEDAEQVVSFEEPNTSSDEGIPLIETITDEKMISPERVMLQREEIERLRAALDKLLPCEREALLLEYYEGFTNQEISDTLGKAPSTVRKYKNKGIKKLRTELSMHTQEEN